MGENGTRRALTTCASSCPGNLTGSNWDEEGTKDRKQTCRKLGSGTLGARMETHNSSVYFFSVLLLLFKILYKI
jgi:hypothetical protein